MRVAVWREAGEMSLERGGTQTFPLQTVWEGFGVSALSGRAGETSGKETVFLSNRSSRTHTQTHTEKNTNARVCLCVSVYVSVALSVHKLVFVCLCLHVCECVWLWM